MRILWLTLALLAWPARAQEPQPAAPARATENLILVTLDGLRWQEVFAGADNLLMHAETGAGC
jgi:hypothetical protein